MTTNTTPPRGLWKCHHVDLASVVIEQDPMKRAFVSVGQSGEAYRGSIAPHSHRTSIKITCLEGVVWHRTFVSDVEPLLSGFSWPRISGTLHTYRSRLLGGDGLSFSNSRAQFYEIEQSLSPGTSLVLRHHDIHTVSWLPGSIWLVEEGPLMSENTDVFIRDNIDVFATEGLYEPMKDHEYAGIADRVWCAWKALR